MAPPTRERGPPLRLFVGGVAAGVTAAELAERFTPFGQVTGVQLVAGKAQGARAPRALRGRGRRLTRTPQTQAAAATRRAAPPTWTCCRSQTSATRTSSAASAWCARPATPAGRILGSPRLTLLAPHLFAAQYNGCTWRGSRLRVERAVEHFTSRLRREEQAASAAAAARAAAATAAALQAAAAATPEAQAAARLALSQQLRESTLLIQSRCPSKVRVPCRVRY